MAPDDGETEIPIVIQLDDIQVKEGEGHDKKIKLDIPVERVVFHEITKKAILDAIQNPRKINYDLVVPSIFIIISILLISKIPTYSLKKIVVPKRALGGTFGALG